MAESDGQKPVDRRRFFRAALGEMFKPLSKSIAPITRAAQELGNLSDAPAPGRSTPASRPPPAGAQPRRSPLPLASVLRPPGALPGNRFMEACTQCGDCVLACPVMAIKVEPGGRGGGFPFIAPAEQACELCDGLRCMNHCPSGALIPVPLSHVKIGTAVWRESTCVRSAGGDCTICIDKCPIGSAAIELRDGLITVHEAKCTGCGICEQKCPTKPKAIVVKPSE